MTYIATDARSFLAKPEAVCIVGLYFATSPSGTADGLEELVGGVLDEGLREECRRLGKVVEELGSELGGPAGM